MQRLKARPNCGLLHCLCSLLNIDSCFFAVRHVLDARCGTASFEIWLIINQPENVPRMVIIKKCTYVFASRQAF